MDMNFIFSWSTRYLTRSLRSLVRYRVDHSKIKFISTRGHVISSIYVIVICIYDNDNDFISRIEIMQQVDYVVTIYTWEED